MNMRDEALFDISWELANLRFNEELINVDSRELCNSAAKWATEFEELWSQMTEKDREETDYLVQISRFVRRKARYEYDSFVGAPSYYVTNEVATFCKTIVVDVEDIQETMLRKAIDYGAFAEEHRTLTAKFDNGIEMDIIYHVVGIDGAPGPWIEATLLQNSFVICSQVYPDGNLLRSYTLLDKNFNTYTVDLIQKGGSAL